MSIKVAMPTILDETEASCFYGDVQKVLQKKTDPKGVRDPYYETDNGGLTFGYFLSQNKWIFVSSTSGGQFLSGDASTRSWDDFYLYDVKVSSLHIYNKEGEEPSMEDVSDVQVCVGSSLVNVNKIVKDSVTLWERPVVKFVACGKNGRIAYSYDGVAWTATTIIGYTGDVRDVCFANGMFVAVGGSKCFWSDDGINWSTCSFSSSDNLTCVCYGNGKFVAGAYFKTVAISSDGKNWTTASCNNFYANDIAYGNGKYVMLDGSGSVEVSTNATSWSSKDLGVGSLMGIYCGDGMFIACSMEGKIVESEDCDTWYTLDPGFDTGYRDICGNDDRFIAVGSQGEILYLNDSSEWVNYNCGISGCEGACCGNGKLVIVSTLGSIAYASSYSGPWTTAATGFGYLFKVCARK